MGGEQFFPSRESFAAEISQRRNAPDSKRQHGTLQHVNLSSDFLAIFFFVPVLLEEKP